MKKYKKVYFLIFLNQILKNNFINKKISYFFIYIKKS